MASDGFEALPLYVTQGHPNQVHWRHPHIVVNATCTWISRICVGWQDLKNQTQSVLSWWVFWHSDIYLLYYYAPPLWNPANSDALALPSLPSRCCCPWWCPTHPIVVEAFVSSHDMSCQLLLQGPSRLFVVDDSTQCLLIQCGLCCKGSALPIPCQSIVQILDGIDLEQGLPSTAQASRLVLLPFALELDTSGIKCPVLRLWAIWHTCDRISHPFMSNVDSLKCSFFFFLSCFSTSFMGSRISEALIMSYHCLWDEFRPSLQILHHDSMHFPELAEFQSNWALILASAHSYLLPSCCLPWALDFRTIVTVSNRWHYSLSVTHNRRNQRV